MVNKTKFSIFLKSRFVGQKKRESIMYFILIYLIFHTNFEREIERERERVPVGLGK